MLAYLEIVRTPERLLHGGVQGTGAIVARSRLKRDRARGGATEDGTVSVSGNVHAGRAGRCGWYVPKLQRCPSKSRAVYSRDP